MATWRDVIVVSSESIRKFWLLCSSLSRKTNYNSPVLITVEIILFSLYIDNRSLTDRATLLSEIRMLKQAGRHPNIVNLVGACTQGGKY